MGEAPIPVPSEDASDGLERNAKRNFHVAAYWSSARDDRSFRDSGKLRHYPGFASLKKSLGEGFQRAGSHSVRPIVHAGNLELRFLAREEFRGHRALSPDLPRRDAQRIQPRELRRAIIEFEQPDKFWRVHHAVQSVVAFPAGPEIPILASQS